jgi:hypothetical protein
MSAVSHNVRSQRIGSGSERFECRRLRCGMIFATRLRRQSSCSSIFFRSTAKFKLRMIWTCPNGLVQISQGLETSDSVSE